MINLIFLALFSASAQSATLDLLKTPFTQTHGSVERTGYNSLSVSAGLFSISAIYKSMPLRGHTYEIKSTFTRTRGSDGVGFVFPAGQSTVAAVFGGWSGGYDGINQVDGRNPGNSTNPTSRRTKIVNGDPIAVRIRVSPARITVFVNNALHYDLELKGHHVAAVSDIQSRFQDGFGLYIVNGDIDVESLSIEE